jgi:hypothetical protein
MLNITRRGLLHGAMLLGVAPAAFSRGDRAVDLATVRDALDSNRFAVARGEAGAVEATEEFAATLRTTLDWDHRPELAALTAEAHCEAAAVARDTGKARRWANVGARIADEYELHDLRTHAVCLSAATFFDNEPLAASSVLRLPRPTSARGRMELALYRASAAGLARDKYGAFVFLDHAEDLLGHAAAEPLQPWETKQGPPTLGLSRPAVAMRAGSHDHAVRGFREVLPQIDPDFPVVSSLVSSHLAESLFHLGELDETVAIATQIATETSRATPGKIRGNLDRLRLRLDARGVDTTALNEALRA